MTVPLEEITGECAVLSISEYMEKYSVTTKESSPSQKVPPNVFFTRQSYDTATDAAIPSLKPVCYCNTILNPNDPTSRCKNCGVYLHYFCIENNKNKPCPVCGAGDTPLSQKRGQPEEASPKPLESVRVSGNS